MNTFVIDAQARTSGEKAKSLRSKNKIPAICYGTVSPQMTVSFDYQAFKKIFDKAGENTIVELNVDGKNYPVLIYALQFDPVTDRISHVDLMQVDMTREVTANVKLNFVGVPPAVKNLGGIMDVKKHELKIKCLPKDLLHTIEVDVTVIEDFHTSIHVSDIKVSQGIKILDGMSDTVVTVSPVRVEKETTPTTAAATPEAGAAATAAGAAGTPAAGAAPAAAPAKK
ncbi:50S ribosomal protein L25 [Candidatus Gracilibacteria bacterium]|nr:50S ribosomal protein L25 [Candidatus Gracilibacteria bacterium]